jgi:signal transduction histidine kinase
LIGASHREGALGPEPSGLPEGDRLFGAVDRRLPLGLKVVVTVTVVAALGTVLFGYMVAGQPKLELIWIIVIGVAIAALEAGLLTAGLEYGVGRRIRRVHALVAAFGRGGHRSHLPEGSQPPGRDAMFNLAREVDLKLRELDQRERAGAVVTDLGLLSLQGATPSDLATRALRLVCEAADLDRCLLVDKAGPAVIVSSGREVAEKIQEADLPVWLSALARASARTRKPVLAGRHGQDPGDWDGATVRAASVAFVPMSGTIVATGVMVGIAHPGNQVTSSTVSLMEGVATALSESLERSEAMRARQESADKSKALATVSHEMRNPLNAMLGFSELLLNGSAGQLNEKQRLYMQQVSDASHHLLDIVNDYLDLTRVSAGSLPLLVEAVQVGPEVRSVIELMSASAGAKQVSLHSYVGVDGVAQVDRLRLRQVLVNLVANAIRSTPARGHVRVEVAGGSNGVRISVIDTGVGVPADRQHLVFVEFADLHPGEASDGTGLGLALSKHFVEGMGGFIRFTSAEGAGSIFDIWLPGENSPHTAERLTQAGSTSSRQRIPDRSIQ